MEDVSSTKKKKGCSIMPPPTGPRTEVGLGTAIRECIATATRPTSVVAYLLVNIPHHVKAR